MQSKASCIHVEDEKKTRVENLKIVSRQSTHHTWPGQNKRDKLNMIDFLYSMLLTQIETVVILFNRHPSSSSLRRYIRVNVCKTEIVIVFFFSKTLSQVSL